MPNLVDHRNRPIPLGNQLAAGGEGAIFEVTGRLDLVAKVYHRPPDPTRSAKLVQMLSTGSGSLSKVAAWPEATLHEKSSSSPVIGFVMPRATDFYEIHRFYSPSSRKKSFPNVTWRFLVHAALNCARAFDSLHAAGHVMGDVNPNNVLVSERAMVRLIDCDSFQIRGPGELFVCPVGMAEYTPPELQKQDLSKVVREINHDLFGLALLVFQLLFMGRHPYVGVYSGAGDAPPLERAIHEHRYAFGKDAARYQMRPPPASLPVSASGSGVADLFERAFSPSAGSGRPTAAEWENALGRLEASLTKCTQDSSHLFAPGASCPWCQIYRSTGQLFFGQPSATPGSTTFTAGLEDLRPILESLIEISRASPIPAILPPAAPSAPTPLSSDAAAERQQLAVQLLATRSTAVATAAFAALAAAGVEGAARFAFGCVLALAVWLVWGWRLRSSSLIAFELGSRVQEVKIAQDRVSTESQLLLELETRCRDQIGAAVERSRQLSTAYKQLQTDYQSEISALESGRAEAQRRQHLMDRLIEEAAIKQIGKQRLETLRVNGVETAYDVLTTQVRGISGFGDTLREALLSWARSVDAQFRFDPNQAIPAHERMMVVLKYRQRQAELRTEIEKEANTAKALFQECSQRATALASSLGGSQIRLVRAKANLSVGTN